MIQLLALDNPAKKKTRKKRVGRKNTMARTRRKSVRRSPVKRRSYSRARKRTRRRTRRNPATPAFMKNIGDIAGLTLGVKLGRMINEPLGAMAVGKDIADAIKIGAGIFGAGILPSKIRKKFGGILTGIGVQGADSLSDKFIPFGKGKGGQTIAGLGEIIDTKSGLIFDDSGNVISSVNAPAAIEADDIIEVEGLGDAVEEAQHVPGVGQYDDYEDDSEETLFGLGDAVEEAQHIPGM